ncbi:MAG: hypoxanthine phosphoribosyltransferase [Chlorobiaceae bacterium]|nr:hypoxanthine phosphoribosyltransferase [Chlorobiaceae bacterium]
MATGLPSEYISAEQITARVKEMGQAVSDDHADATELTVVCVLNGAFIFTADLVRQITVPCRLEFIRASSYGLLRSSSGMVTLNHDLDLEARRVLLVEDIIDTGLTLSRILDELQRLRPASLKICTLLDKPSARKIPVEADYTGFTIPDLFVVGYGLDSAGLYRELPFIAIPDP